MSGLGLPKNSSSNSCDLQVKEQGLVAPPAAYLDTAYESQQLS